MRSKEELNAMKEEMETLNKKLAELSEEELEQVTGGREYTLTDELIKQGEYAVGQADVIIYNGERYYDQHQCIKIDRIDMFLYKSGTGATLMIPFCNYC